MSARRARPAVTLGIQIASRAAGIPSGKRLSTWVEHAAGRPCEVTLRIVGRPEARRLNLDYRGRDYATNVLTFVYGDAPVLTGDIAICAPVVTSEARRQGKTTEAHWAHLVVHGMLHLQGYDHERSARDAARMERLETQILRDLGYPDPYLIAA